MQPKQKRCNKCKEIKDISCFYLDKHHKDGRYSQCKDCKLEIVKMYNKINKKKKQEYDRIYHKKHYKNNKEERSKYNKKWKEFSAKFDIYAPQLEIAEEIRNANGNLEVKCTYCGKWFKPSNSDVICRIEVLTGERSGEARFYCSNDCKKECSIYNQKKYPKDFKPSTSREVQPELRQMVFKRDEYECQICGSTKSLHCHHITGVVQNPIESADVDNCITLCKKCHKWIHTQSGCTHDDLKCKNMGSTLD